MPTPLALTLSPLLWAVLAAAALCVLGIVVGRTTGRLVHLFGPAHPPRSPEPTSGARAPGTPLDTVRAEALSGQPVPPGQADPSNLVVPPGQDSVTGTSPIREGAPGTPSHTSPGTPRRPGSDPNHGSGSGSTAGTAASPGPEDEDGPPPPSCPHCLAELRFARGLPLVAARSFRQRGLCPHCDQCVRPHVAVVVTTAVLFALVGSLTPGHLASWSPLGLLAVLWLVAIGVPLSVIDLRVLRLPDALVAPAYLVAALLLGAAILLPPVGPDLERGSQALVSMALITVLYWFMWRIRPGGLGFGDVKLSGLTGLYAGWVAGPVGALVAAFWAFAAFSLLGLVLLALRRITRTEPLPLGPFMLAATLATVLAAQPLLPNTL